MTRSLCVISLPSNPPPSVISGWPLNLTVWSLLTVPQGPDSVCPERERERLLREGWLRGHSKRWVTGLGMERAQWREVKTLASEAWSSFICSLSHLNLSLPFCLSLTHSLMFPNLFCPTLTVSFSLCTLLSLVSRKLHYLVFPQFYPQPIETACQSENIAKDGFLQAHAVSQRGRNRSMWLRNYTTEMQSGLTFSVCTC